MPRGLHSTPQKHVTLTCVPSRHPAKVAASVLVRVRRSLV
jgi:hypothetical protein